MTDDEIPIGPPVVGGIIAVLSVYSVYVGEFDAGVALALLLAAFTLGYYLISPNFGG